MVATKDEQTGRWSLSEVEPETETYQRMVKMVKDGVSFKFARYGDGEIYCMNGKSGHNCDQHTYFRDLGIELRRSIFTEPDYMVGIQPLSVSHLPEDVNRYFGHFKTLYNADVLHSASIDGQLSHFFKALTGRYIILCGPAHLAGLFDGIHIVIPSTDCWLQYEKIKQQLLFHLDCDDAVVLLCASMMSEVLISDFAYSKHTFIDCGSVFDIYAGVKSRRYHHKLTIDASK